MKTYGFSRADAQAAFREGLTRLTAHGGQHTHGWNPTTAEGRDYNGYSAVSEALVAHVTGRRWLSRGRVPDGDQPDIDGGIQVRWTPHNDGHLLVWHNDNARFVYVGVVGTGYPLTIVGWRSGLACQQQRFWKHEREQLGQERVREAGWFVPQKYLALGLINPLDRLVLLPGSDPHALLDSLADPVTMMQWIGEGAFGIRYDEHGDAIS